MIVAEFAMLQAACRCSLPPTFPDRGSPDFVEPTRFGLSTDFFAPPDFMERTRAMVAPIGLAESKMPTIGLLPSKICFS